MVQSRYHKQETDKSKEGTVRLLAGSGGASGEVAYTKIGYRLEQAPYAKEHTKNPDAQRSVPIPTGYSFF